TINNVPFAVLLPYNDGDVSDLQGAHFFDDSRYNAPGDTGSKYSILVMGANHNFYNTVWSPGGFPAGASDDGNSGPPSRLSQAAQRATGLASIPPFPPPSPHTDAKSLPTPSADPPPPPSAQAPPARIPPGSLPPDTPPPRRDVNRLLTSADLTTNT